MFWKNFVSLCSNVGKSTTAVVLELGLSRSLVTSWKNGTMPNNTTLVKIANFFNVTVESLLLEKNNPSESAPEGLDKYDSEILTLFSALPENKKQQAVSYLEFLRQQDSEDK